MQFFSYARVDAGAYINEYVNRKTAIYVFKMQLILPFVLVFIVH